MSEPVFTGSVISRATGVGASPCPQRNHLIFSPFRGPSTEFTRRQVMTGNALRGHFFPQLFHTPAPRRSTAFLQVFAHSGRAFAGADGLAAE